MLNKITLFREREREREINGCAKILSWKKRQTNLGKRNSDKSKEEKNKK